MVVSPICWDSYPRSGSEVWSTPIGVLLALGVFRLLGSYWFRELVFERLLVVVFWSFRMEVEELVGCLAVLGS